MIEISPQIFIGNDHDCVQAVDDWAIVHACKTCHQKGVGYRGNLNSSHPNYLIYESGKHLYLNLVDMEREFQPRFTHPIMQASFRFIEQHHKNQDILIHCTQGYSRSPALGLLWLARQNCIKSGSYSLGVIDFVKIYPEYSPGRGIELYMQKNWQEIMEL